MSTYRIDVFLWHHKDTTCSTIHLRAFFLDTHFIESRAGAEQFARKMSGQYAKQGKCAVAITISPKGKTSIFGQRRNILDLLSWANTVSRATVLFFANGAL